MIKRIWSKVVIRLALLLNRKQPKFRVWAEVEGLKEITLNGLKKGEMDFPQKLHLLISKSLGIKEKHLHNIGWEESIVLFYFAIMKNAVKIDLPIVTARSDEKHKKEDWEYEGRLWHYYSHILANAYGWSLDEIEKLSVFDAMAQIEEVWVQEQLDNEFWWANQGNASVYDAKSKTSKDNPLPRPSFMHPKVQKIKKFKIPANMIPAGADMSAIDETLRPKEIKSE